MMKKNATKEDFALILSLPSWKVEVRTESKSPWGSIGRLHRATAG